MIHKSIFKHNETGEKNLRIRMGGKIKIFATLNLQNFNKGKLNLHQSYGTAYNSNFTIKKKLPIRKNIFRTLMFVAFNTRILGF